MDGSAVPRLVVCSLVALVASAAVSEAVWSGPCTPEPLINVLPQRQPLPDSAIAASTHAIGCPAHMARSNSSTGCAAWCPASTFQEGASAPSQDWLQIDLGRVVNISYVETYGRFADGKGSEYVSEYKLQYDRGDGRGFVWYLNPQDRRGGREPPVHVFRGNIDTYNSETVPVKYLVAQSIRIVPIQQTSQVQPCLRLEVYGCQTDGVIAYTVAPQPPDSLFGLSTGDRPYDGTRVGGSLHGGLGILTDGDVGSVISRTASGNLLQGHGWVGWPQASGPVVLTFEFDVHRIFASARVTSYDDGQLSVRLFDRSVWQCSDSATSYPPGQQHTFLRSRPGSETGSVASSSAASAAAAIVTGRASLELTFGSERPCHGRFVKVEFYWVHGGLLLSEISFKSIVSGRAMPTLTASAGSGGAAAAGGSRQPTVREGDLEPEPTGMEAATAFTGAAPTRDSSSGEDAEWSDAFPKTRIGNPAADSSALSSSHMIGVFAGAGAGAFVLIVCLVVTLCLCHVRIRRRKQRRRAGSADDGKRCPELECESPLYGGSGDSGGHERSLAALRQHPQEGYNGGYRSEMVTINSLGYTGLPQKDGIYEEPWSHCHPAERQPFAMTHQTLHGMVPSESVRSYAVMPDSMGPAASSLMPPEGMLLPLSNYLPGRLQMLPPLPPQVPGFDDKPMPAELLSVTIEGAAGNSLMGGSKFTDVCPDTLSAIMPYRLDRQCLHFVEKLGEGRFGEIHLCEVLDSAGEGGSHGTPLGCRRAPCPSLVVMKILRRDVDHSVRSSFYQELANAAQFRDPNVACLLSAFAAASDESPYMVAEYEENGDLHEYLSRRSPPAASISFDSNASTSSAGFQRGRGDVSRGALVYIACQVASGMKYLEKVGVVHRDLAARNVLLGNLYAVKITDIAMSRHRNAPAYCRLGGGSGRALLPVRWMAPESLCTGKFSSRSDVWSFGVLLWEVFTFAQMPYQQLSDEQVVECGLRVFRSATQQPSQQLESAPPQPSFPCLPRPGNCLKEVYDLMLECWNVTEGDRPAFCEIHMFLTRKNVGYDPQQDVATSAGGWLLSSQEPLRRLVDDGRGSVSSMHSTSSASPGRAATVASGRDERAAARLAARKP